MNLFKRQINNYKFSSKDINKNKRESYKERRKKGIKCYKNKENNNNLSD